MILPLSDDQPAPDEMSSLTDDILSAFSVFKSNINPASGKNNYTPIPYQKSCKITANKNWGAYFHYGQTLERLFRADQARQVYERGIEVAGRLGQAHARAELETALDLLG